MEFAGGEVTLLSPVELDQAGEHHGADGDVDAHPEGVSAADDGEQARASQAFDEPSVARQHACVVDADAAAQQARHSGTESAAEAEVPQGGGDLVLVRPSAQVHAQQRGRPVDRLPLGEMDHVDRGPALSHQPLK